MREKTLSCLSTNSAIYVDADTFGSGFFSFFFRHLIAYVTHPLHELIFFGFFLLFTEEQNPQILTRYWRRLGLPIVTFTRPIHRFFC